MIGAMDRCPDAGVVWRRRLRKELDGLSIVWLDPTDKPIKMGVEDDESRRRRRKHKMDGNYDLVTEEMKPIRQVDLRMTDICDWAIVNLDLDAYACGTMEELFLANRQRKPIIVHVEQGKKNLPDWLFATIPHQMCFSTWSEVTEYLHHVNSAPEVETYNRWRFFDFTGDGP